MQIINMFVVSNPELTSGTSMPSWSLTSATSWLPPTSSPSPGSSKRCLRPINRVRSLEKIWITFVLSYLFSVNSGTFCSDEDNVSSSRCCSKWQSRYLGSWLVFSWGTSDVNTALDGCTLSLIKIRFIQVETLRGNKTGIGRIEGQCYQLLVDRALLFALPLFQLWSLELITRILFLSH